MEEIKESNKNLIALRNNYFAALMLVSGGVAGLLLSGNRTVISIFLLIFGFYLILLFISKFQDASKKIDCNIKRSSKC